MAEEISLYVDGSEEIKIDADEFGIIKLMIEEAGARDNLAKLKDVIADLVVQGYNKTRAMNVCLLARRELLSDYQRLTF